MFKQKIKEWLGIDKLEYQNNNSSIRIGEIEYALNELSSGFVDVNFHSQTQIYIVSKLGKGYFNQISVRFDNLAELTKFIENTKRRYHIEQFVYDISPALRNYIGD